MFSKHALTRALSARVMTSIPRARPASMSCLQNRQSTACGLHEQASHALPVSECCGTRCRRTGARSRFFIIVRLSMESSCHFWRIQDRNSSAWQSSSSGHPLSVMHSISDRSHSIMPMPFDIASDVPAGAFSSANMVWIPATGRHTTRAKRSFRTSRPTSRMMRSGCRSRRPIPWSKSRRRRRIPAKRATQGRSC